MTYRRCHHCRAFYDKKLPACGNCGTAGFAFNKWLRTAQLNNHLYGLAENTERERAYERAPRQAL